jgi:diguanylate cyclase (GGDEF)-like protein/hemerythrin-like metal-binding protein
MRNNASSVGGDQIGPLALGALLANSHVVPLAVIRDGRIVFANPAFLAEFHAPGSLTGVLLSDIVADVMDRLDEALATAEHQPTTYWGVDGRGSDTTPDVKLELEGAVLDGECVVIVFASHMAERHRHDERLSYLAFTDTLTGVANRALFADRLHRLLLSARRSNLVFALLMIDLDGFKAVNDAHGHDAGDTVLQLAVRRFQRCIRDVDTLARLGGDEFAVLLTRLDATPSAAVVAERMIKALKEPLDLGAYQVTVGVSIGIAAFPEHATSVDSLMATADAALLRAKRAGKNQFQWATERFAVDTSLVPTPTWSVARSVGIEEIDSQHAHLGDLIDMLSVELTDGTDAAATLANLQALISYARLHFATEERLMVDHRLASLEPHRNAHRRLLDDIGNLEVEDDLPSISLILRYLREWLLRHIDGFDKELGQALIALGVH